MIVLTCDTEWANDKDIQQTFALAEQYRVDLFPFLTHPVPYLQERPHGVHPNFLPGSTHGKTEEEVIAHVTAFAPKARAFRSHCFYDHTRLQWSLLGRGFKTDSNACHFLQGCDPFITSTGIRRYPVYWADDIHFRQNRPDVFDESLFSDYGLRIANIHPPVKSHFVRELFRYARGRSVPFAELI